MTMPAGDSPESRPTAESELMTSIVDSSDEAIFSETLDGVITTWNKAAERLYVHRHTLRYRMKRVEDITGRDLGSSQDRMEFWLALKARELVAQSGKRPRAVRQP